MFRETRGPGLTNRKNPIMGKLKQKMIEGCADQVPAEVREAEKRTFSILRKFWDESAGR